MKFLELESKEKTPKEEADLKAAIAKLRRALKAVQLNKLNDDELTNKACVETIADICTDQKHKFTCE